MNSTVNSSNATHFNRTNPIIRQESSGLSAGQICAIVIPLVALLIGAAIASCLLKGSSVAPVIPPPMTNITPNYIDTSSLAKINVPTQVIEPKPIQQQVIKRVEPPVNQNVPVQQVQTVPVQQVQTVPVQEVTMVPVQEVTMVPVQEVQMVPVQEVPVVPVQEVQVAPVQVQEITQVEVPTHTRGLSSAVEFVQPPQ